MLKYLIITFAFILLIYFIFFFYLRQNYKEYFNLDFKLKLKIPKNIFKYYVDQDLDSINLNSKIVYFNKINKKVINYFINKESYKYNVEINNEYFQSRILNKIIDSLYNQNKYSKLKYKLLQGIEYDYYTKFKGNLLNKLLYDEFIFKIIKQINQTIYEENIYIKDNLFKYFIILKIYYLSIEQCIIYSSILRITAIVNIYRPLKLYGFQLRIIYVIDNNKLYILKIEIIGNFLDSEITKLEGVYLKSLKDLNSMKFDHNYFKLNQNKNKTFEKNILLSNDKLTLIFPKDSELSAIINEYKEYILNPKLANYRCFGYLTDNYKTCILNEGIWDTPCKTNEDCPFYQKNKNYPNNFGGCNRGYCQMPLGLKRLGYKYYDDLNDAICHNCNTNSNYKCCLDQLKNLNNYPNLESPDYAFKNDNRLLF